MTASKTTLRSVLLALLPCAFAAPAFALSPTTYVSATGTDSGACATAASACRNFGYAINQTTPSGAVIALTAGNYGKFTVKKSLTIIGVPGATVKPNAAGVAIEIDSAFGVVNLFGLDIDGSGNPTIGATGVEVKFAGKVTIKNCTIHNFAYDGVFFQDSTRFLIENTTFANLGNVAVDVHSAYPAVAIGGLQGVTVNNASTGVFVWGNNRISVIDTAVVNGSVGYSVQDKATLEIAHSSARHNLSYGLQKLGAASKVESAGNNFFRDNGTNTSAGITVVGGQ
jgi:nitrous oxidase accessory protein NosD